MVTRDWSDDALAYLNRLARNINFICIIYDKYTMKHRKRLQYNPYTNGIQKKVKRLIWICTPIPWLPESVKETYNLINLMTDNWTPSPMHVQNSVLRRLPLCCSLFVYEGFLFISAFVASHFGVILLFVWLGRQARFFVQYIDLPLWFIVLTCSFLTLLTCLNAFSDLVCKVTMDRVSRQNIDFSPLQYMHFVTPFKN